MDRRHVLTGSFAALAMTRAAQAAIPAGTLSAPAGRTFDLTPDTVSALGRIAPQAPVFVSGYLRSHQANPTVWNYEDGVIWKGALDLYATTRDKAFLDFVTGDMKGRVMPDGSLPLFKPQSHNIDSINSGKVLFSLYEITGETRFRTALDTQFTQLKTHPRTKSGNYWHKQVYPSQVWLDGLYMAQPFQVAYARITHNAALFDDTVKQFLAVEAVMKNPQTGLYYHGWDESRIMGWADPKTGLSPNIWGRAMGWWVCALVDSYDQSQGLEAAGRAEIARITRDTLAALIKVRSPRGLWYQVVNQSGRSGNYEEASASLMISYALLKAARLGIAGASEKAVGQQSLKASIDVFLTPTALNGICGVAGLGGKPYRDGSYAYYTSEKIRPNDPKGVGPLMWAISEALQA
jgi:unsaturated rhamnogalacturonyl hydrolase